MTSRDRKKYIQEIFKFVKTDSILVIDHNGQLRRLGCPFNVIVISDVPPLKEGQVKAVIAVKIDENLVDVYIIDARAFYYYNFKVEE